MKQIIALAVVSFVGLLCWAFTAELLISSQQQHLMNGEWRIKKVQDKTTGQTITTAKDYKIKFYKASFSLHLDVNSCLGKADITSNTIRTSPDQTTCSTACCDTKEAKALAAMLDSPSLKTYQIQGSQLTISDKKYIIWLKATK
ncbi:META domain-containing protein [uncultured Microscilla sp.]|uniref:META domain-containing protein n=1 Tax=uncultured Microscilla sp. TaxID=432653 RepID=UPI00262D91AC|nr:META domain-containing protein [uncultured Microscilla sp.]